MTRFGTIAVAALVVVGLAPVPAQIAGCPQDDPFAYPLTGAVPCCGAPVGSFPTFPSKVVPGRGGVLRDCAVEYEFDMVTTFIPAQVSCDEWKFGFYTGSQNPRFAIQQQVLYGKYSRTWKEYPKGPAGTVIQVWRFLVNGDLRYSFPSDAPDATSPGVIPLSALPPHELPVHFVGNLDYARNCTTGAWEVAYTLTHFCPLDMHGALSQRPLPASPWPKRTYHFVGPRGFTFGDGTVPVGNTYAQSWRTSTGYVTNPGTHRQCFKKGTAYVFITPNLLTVYADCACRDAPATLSRYKHQSLSFLQTCGTYTYYLSSNASVVPGVLPMTPTGLRAYVLGTWGPIPGVDYPGSKTVSAYLGVLDAPPLCPSLQQPPANMVTGVGNTGGHAIELFTTSPTITVLASLDLEDMLVPTAWGYAQGFGAAFVSERVWSLITPDPPPTGGGGGGGGGPPP